MSSGLSCMSSNSAPRVELSILKQELTKDETGAAVAEVTVKNISRDVAELAEVRVDFYDAAKNLVDSSRDSVMNLGPDETWDFKIKCQGERCGAVTRADIQATAGASSGRF
jgi:hypothetical protein